MLPHLTHFVIVWYTSFNTFSYHLPLNAVEILCCHALLSCSLKSFCNHPVALLFCCHQIDRFTLISGGMLVQTDAFVKLKGAICKKSGMKHSKLTKTIDRMSRNHSFVTVYQSKQLMYCVKETSTAVNVLTS